MNRTLLLLVLLVAGCGAEGTSGRPASATPPPTSEQDGDDPVSLADRRAREMIDRGLLHLVESQNGDGSFGGPEASHVRIAVSALSCLALLADGHVEERGRHHRAVTRGLKFLMACSIREGPRKGLFEADGDSASRMHGHGFATLALAEACGTFGVRRKYASSAEELAAIVKDAVDVVVRSQSRAGGWYYEPFEELEDEGSITVCMIQALRAARDAGFHVPVRTVDRAIDYIRRSQKPDGSIRYRLHGDLSSTFELTAAGAATLVHAGDYYADALVSARDHLHRESDTFFGGGANYPYYGLFYLAQSAHFDYDDVGGRRLERLWPRIVRWFQDRHEISDGSWRGASLRRDREAEYGAVYRTAFACLTLLVREGWLPIFQR